MAVDSQEIGRGGKHFMSSDLVYDVLGRVDAMTLAKASCVSSQFRAVCRDEAFWEKLCNSRWPSTKEVSAVKALVASVGGFRKFYAGGFPCTLGKGAPKTVVERLRVCDRDRIEELGEPSASDFVSVVDVVYNGESVLSRVVECIPGAEESQVGFADCPFRVDILESPGVEVDDVTRKDEEGATGVTIRTKLPRIPSVAWEKKDGKFWTELCDEMRVSWILMNKKTLRMANLASWNPMGGLHHRPACGVNFLLRFGSILPTSTATSDGAIHCNITMKCSTSATAEADDHPTTTLRLTELSLQLEDVHGAHLNGRNAIATLSAALMCQKTVAKSEAARIFHAFMASQNARRESLIRRENRRRIAEALVSCILTAFICFFYVVF